MSKRLNIPDSGERLQALVAGGEVTLWQRMLARYRASKRGADDAEEFRQIRRQMPRFRELPGHFAWDSLAAEMKANIVLGVEAGEAVRPRFQVRPIGWRAGLVMATLSLLMISGYWWQMPRRWVQPPAFHQAVLQASPGQLGVRLQESGFSVMFQETTASTVLSGASDSVRADFVDTETGQLTVAHVYLD